MSIATDFIPKNIKLKISEYRGVIWGKVVYRLAFISLFVSLWWFTSTYGANGLLPTPMATVKAMVTIFTDGEFFFHITNTIRRVLLPFVAVWAVSVVIGVAMGISQKAEQFFDIGIVIGLTIPGLAWAIISVMIFGLRPLSAYFAVFMIVLPIVTINFWEGVKDIDTDLIQMGEVFGLSRRKQITEIVLPQLLPYMFFLLGLA